MRCETPEKQCRTLKEAMATPCAHCLKSVSPNSRKNFKILTSSDRPKSCGRRATLLYPSSTLPLTRELEVTMTSLKSRWWTSYLSRPLQTKGKPNVPKSKAMRTTCLWTLINFSNTWKTFYWRELSAPRNCGHGNNSDAYNASTVEVWGRSREARWME